jgi:hypothetical protein
MPVIPTPVVPVTASAGLLGKLQARYARAKQLREPWISEYEECYEYALPSRESFYAQAAGQSRTDKIFDETAVVGVQEFASRLQAGLIPNYARWAELVSGSEVPEDDRSEVNEALEAVTEYVFEVIQNSNFAQEANETLLDIALGTACMRIDEGDALNPVMFTAVPLPQLALDVGPDDKLDTIFRERSIRTSNIKIAYPKAVLPAELERELATGVDNFESLVECVYRDWSTPGEEVNMLAVFLPQRNHMLFTETYKGIGSNPYVAFRWSKAAGEVWGRGPLLSAMPAVKTTNLVVQMILENAQMAISGIYTAEDDGVVNPATIRLVPGTIIPVAPGSSGLRAVSSAGSFDVAQLVLSDMRLNIKKALYNEMLGNPNTTPMSATEVAQRMADLSRQIGSAFGRLQAEFVNPVLRRVVYILKKQGRISIPVINGREVKVRSTSPLAQAQAFEDINAINRFLEMVQGRFGPQMVNLYVKGDETTKYLAAKFGVPERLIRDEAEREQLAGQIAQMGQNGIDTSQITGA